MQEEVSPRTRLEWRPRTAAAQPAYARSRVFETMDEAVAAAAALANGGGVIGDEFRLTPVDDRGAATGPVRHLSIANPRGAAHDATAVETTSWSRSLVRANARMVVMTGIRSHLVAAWNNGLLRRAQAATIADIVEMAFDGFGPAGLPPPAQTPKR